MGRVVHLDWNSNVLLWLVDLDFLCGIYKMRL